MLNDMLLVLLLLMLLVLLLGLLLLGVKLRLRSHDLRRLRLMMRDYVCMRRQRLVRMDVGIVLLLLMLLRLRRRLGGR